MLNNMPVIKVLDIYNILEFISNNKSKYNLDKNLENGYIKKYWIYMKKIERPTIKKFNDNKKKLAIIRNVTDIIEENNNSQYNKKQKETIDFLKIDYINTKLDIGIDLIDLFLSINVGNKGLDKIGDIVPFIKMNMNRDIHVKMNPDSINKINNL